MESYGLFCDLVLPKQYVLRFIYIDVCNFFSSFIFIAVSYFIVFIIKQYLAISLLKGPAFYHIYGNIIGLLINKNNL